jgi:hypothetical protein
LLNHAIYKDGHEEILAQFAKKNWKWLLLFQILCTWTP